MNFKFKRQPEDDADLDVTSFLNLMIVLVPVLLLSMTFTQVTVLDIELPELTGGSSKSDLAQSQLEVHLTDSGFDVFMPANQLVAKIAKLDDGEAKRRAGQKVIDASKAVVTANDYYDFQKLSMVMRKVKEQVSEKKDVVLLSAPQMDYQNLVSTMETLKSYKTTIAASVVEVELFPEISLGDTSR